MFKINVVAPRNNEKSNFYDEGLKWKTMKWNINWYERSKHQQIDKFNKFNNNQKN